MTATISSHTVKSLQLLILFYCTFKLPWLLWRYFDALLPLNVNKKGYTCSLLMCVTSRSRRGRPNSVYINAQVIGQVDCVSVNTKILATLQDKDTKFDFKIVLLYAQLRPISNVKCHTQRPPKSEINFFN